MKKIVISNKKATRTHLTAGIVALLLLVCVRMDTVAALAQALVPASSMLGQEIWAVMGIVALWYLVWVGIIVSLIVRVCARAIYTCIK